jgi:hypothetical protein
LTGVVLTAAIGLPWTASPASAACNRDDALVADDFDTLDESWGGSNDNFLVEDGALVIKHWEIRRNNNTAVPFETANVCVDATIVKADAPDSSLGLMFWLEAAPPYSYYYARYSVDGKVEVGRFDSEAGYVPLFVGKTPVIKKGEGQTNHLELLLKPKEGTLFINGTEIKRFRASPPDVGYAGVWTRSPDDKPGIFKFDNFIMNVAK